VPSEVDQGGLSAAVLAGGQSRRMGTDKALIDFDGQPLAVHVAKQLSPISDDVFVVCKQPLDLSVPEVLDELEEHSPLSGIISALYAAQHEYVFICACDMPFVSTDVVEKLVAAIGDAPAVVPRHDGKIEPLHAVWSKQALPRLEEIWGEGERAVHRALHTLEARVLDVDEGQTFVNVNTRGELDAIRPPKERPPSAWKLSGD
jgi:molybdenum cofactor guanylyltransferase